MKAASPESPDKHRTFFCRRTPKEPSQILQIPSISLFEEVELHQGKRLQSLQDEPDKQLKLSDL
jgi:hypothetical protein